MENAELFEDMLVGHERVHHILGAPGPRIKELNHWYQVALTDYRILVVKMVAKDGAAGWTNDKRWAMNRDTVHIGQYPRTTTSAARLEIQGFPEPIHLVDIDRPDLHPHIPPFLQAWNRPVAGVAEIATQPKHSSEPDPDERLKTDNTLWMVLGGGAAVLFLCCGGSVLLRTVYSVISGGFQ